MNERWQKGLLVAAFICILVGASLVQGRRVKSDEMQPFFQQEEVEEEPNVEYIYVDIKGAIEHPGVYKLLKNSRLFQAIDLAGGLRADADGNALNLSIILKDQDVVYVPDVTEEYPIIIYQDESSELGGVININQASLEELQTLPGIGPSTAQKIVDYREEFGLFSTIEDILNVSGIGETTFNDIKDLIIV